MRTLLLLVVSASTLLSATLPDVVVPDNYNILEGEEVTYIYGEEYKKILPDIKRYQKGVMNQYEKEFGFKLDDKLRVGLATQNNQIANGFSTQIPFNSQLFYGAGASYIDYFCFSSWLKTLLIHETAHNFQLNPKENVLSKTGHKIFGNSPITFLALLPIFPIPNIMESSFMLEGNAVVNESRYGNGGRLFSGYALAEVVALAKANKITPQLMYNDTLEFPYGEKFYLVGGFFQQFLVKKYGINRVNGYFKQYSKQPFPFFTNMVFKEQFGESLETLLAEFVDEIKERHSKSKEVQGEAIAKSQFFVPLNRDGMEVYTLIGDRKSAPKLLRLNRKTKELSLSSNSYRVGEVFKRENQFYTQSFAKTSPLKIEMGLFDDDGLLKEDSGSKAIQGYLQNGKEVYFDVPSSIELPQLYIDGEFYTKTYSSVHVDKSDVYYFKQEGEKRTLFKNRTPIVSYEGHYGFVVDVDSDGAIYFVSTSEHGSTVYKVLNGVTTRVTLADNIIDLKLLGEKEAVVATIVADGYEYKIVSLSSTLANPYTQKVVSVEVNNRLSSKAFGISSSDRLESKSYNSLTQLEYSSWSPFFSYSSYDGFGVDAYANLIDPLWQNQVTLIGSHNKKRDIIGATYDNSAFYMEFGGAYYSIFKNENYNNSDKRDEGYEAYLRFPLVESGYWNSSTTLAYTKPYNNIYREPLTLSLDVENSKQYGISKYKNSQNSLSIFASEDRDNRMYGGTYEYKHDLPWQSYVGLMGTYMRSDIVNFFDEKGIELDNTFTNLQSDKATVNVPSFTFRTYAKEVKMAEISLAKVLDGSLYLYSFPLSLQRESLYAKQRYYEIDFTSTFGKSYNETRAGVELDLLFFHKYTIPLSIEWVHNQDVIDPNQVRLLIGGSF